MKSANLAWKWLVNLPSSWNIARKISYGYSLAIGIAITGTSLGLWIGNYYQKTAEKQLFLAEKQIHLLHSLNNYVLKVRFHPQQLVAVLEDSIWFEYETSEFRKNIDQVSMLLSELQVFVTQNPQDSAINSDDFKQLLKKHEETLNDYSQLMESVWQEIDSVNLQLEQINLAQQQVIQAISGKKARKISAEFEYLFEELTRYIQAAETQEKQAKKRLAIANDLRLRTIIAIMALSLIIATILSVITSRAIARPLESVTQVAQQVTQKANFNLQANVITKDEVGLLAASLNQLIEWVGDYTQKLELARETLEQRVAERTQELADTLEDLKQTQAQLIQTEKMSSLGQMVAGVAHEINNPVNFIHGNLTHINNYVQDLLELINLYSEHCPESNYEIEEYIEDIELDFIQEDLGNLLSSMKMGTNRIKEIVLSLRNFSRLDEAELKEANLHEGIDSTLLILNHRLKNGIKISKEYGDLPLVACYPAQLNQVFMNMLSNAIDALEESAHPQPQIRIQTQKQEDFVVISIADNGLGIPEELYSKLFDPFFTTKPVGKGTGLGLSISYQIVEKHRGTITVDSQSGKGTQFVITIPI